MDDQESQYTVQTSNSTLENRSLEREPSLPPSYYDQFDAGSSTENLTRPFTEEHLLTSPNYSESNLNTLHSGAGDESSSVEDDGVDDEDPLQVQSLILNYDYLLFKIQDLTNSLSEQITNSILHFQHDTEKKLEAIDLDKYKAVLNKSKELGLELDKFDQFAFITKDFVKRLKVIDNSLNHYNKTHL